MTTRVFAACLLIFTLASGAHGLTIEDFESSVAFDVTLKELTNLIESGQTARADTERFYILNGTINDVSPKAPGFYELVPQSIFDPAGFLAAVRSDTDAFSLFLKRSLSGETAALLAEWNPLGAVAAELLEAVVGDINNLIKQGTLYGSGIHQSLRLGSDMAALVALDPDGREDRSYLSRLLLETAYPSFVEPTVVLVELVTGEWIGLDDVRSYHALLAVTGPESFKVFYRRRQSEASPTALSNNSRIMVVASLIEPIQLPTGMQAWLMAAHKLRRIN
jgi:hypothetical protein